MAASAAKFGHCQVRPPVEYRSKTPFGPEIAAPLDFAVRAAEVYAIDRELDRAVLGVEEHAVLLEETVTTQAGPGGLLAASDPGAVRSPARPGPVARRPLTPVRRRFAQNLLRLTGETSRFRPPWTESLVQDVNALLLTELGASTPPGEFRTTPRTMLAPDGRVLYIACPPERIRFELQALLDWIDRYGATLHPVIPSAILAQGLATIQPFPAGNGAVARALSVLYLRFFGLPNADLAPIWGVLTQSTLLAQRIMLWTEASGSYSELIDFAMDTVMRAYEVGADRWLATRDEDADLDEIALRLVVRARRVSGWFSAQEAASWVGGRSGQTVLRHLNALVDRGVLESLGQTRAKRFRLTPSTTIAGSLEARLDPRGPFGTRAPRAGRAGREARSVGIETE
jgi:hypothetical protein